MKEIRSLFTVVICLFQLNLFPQEVKNVILMIPDGTSPGFLALSRWYKSVIDSAGDLTRLNVDALVCGMIKTHNSDYKFPDSAPASTAYATGIRSNRKNVGTDSAGVPHISVMELARLKGLSTGIVVSCEFPHATPADFICHYPDRSNYGQLAKQFIYNSPDLVFAGGRSVLEEYHYTGLLEQEDIVLTEDRESFLKIDKLPAGKKLWALFADWQGNRRHKSYECDRKADEPSLSEMTAKAIELLRQNEKGFFLMVEGSLVDWACHDNDAFAAVTEFLEFDHAVGVALDYARSAGNTLVIVCPDHGTGGISMGNAKSSSYLSRSNPGTYDKINIREQLALPLSKVRWSAGKLSGMILKDSAYASADSILKYHNIRPSKEVLERIRSFRRGNFARKADTIQNILSSWLSNETYIGWTTNGHTAEDVFLGIYAPEGTERLTGVIENSDVAHYISGRLELGDPGMNTKIHFRHFRELFNRDEIILLSRDSLVVMKNNKKLLIYGNTDKYKIISGSNFTLGRFGTVAVSICREDKSIEYYIPENASRLLD